MNILNNDIIFDDVVTSHHLINDVDDGLTICHVNDDVIFYYFFIIIVVV